MGILGESTMKINIRDHKEFKIVSLDEVLHMSSDISSVYDNVDTLLNDGVKNIAVKFTDDSYLSSRTGATLIRCWELVSENSGVFILINVNDDIKEFLSIIDLDSQIKTYRDESEIESLEYQ